ncbi:DNA-processing protein DprA [uncultured Jatrophihabitans sp.]|uniref:DNA-processing protein DprA n=1 Tax=uncultured Jatrophihabitans sp. TaxID=1610747 RepID=UPI0035CB391C
MGGVSDDVLVARAYLSRVAEPACIPLWDAVRRLGPVRVAHDIQAGAAEPKVQAAAAVRAGHSDPYADLDAAHRLGIRLVVPESDEWPHFAMSCLEAAALRRLGSFRAGQEQHAEYGEPVPPLALWVQGFADITALGARSVGLVGARAATGYGERVAAELAADLAGRGFEVVSGGAYGIDAAAHRGALSAGVTVLVSAGGLDRAYPPANATLFERVAETGAVISESPPGAAPRRRRFLTRNRLIAALATGTVVVEAARRSGAINTAGHCGRLGRPLMAVPGPVTSPMSAGCHDLIARDGAQAILVTSAQDVLGVIGSSSELPSGHADDSPATSGRTVGGHPDLRPELDLLDETSRRVFDGVPPRRALGLEELAVVAGVAPLDVLRSLPALQLAGLVEERDGGYRLAARVRRTARTDGSAECSP